MKEQLEALVAQMYSTGIVYDEALREFKKRFIVNVLQQCKGNQCRTAIELGMHRNTLNRAMIEFKIDGREFRPGYRKPVVAVKSADYRKRVIIAAGQTLHTL